METKKRENPLKIIVIGCGRWGSFIGWYLDHIGHDVSLYGLKEAPSFQKLLTDRKNEYISLTPTIGLTTNINETKNKEGKLKAKKEIDTLHGECNNKTDG